jgi:hypothetical protein
MAGHPSVFESWLAPWPTCKLMLKKSNQTEFQCLASCCLKYISLSTQGSVDYNVRLHFRWWAVKEADLLQINMIPCKLMLIINTLDPKTSGFVAE